MNNYMRAASITFPIMLGYIPLGMVFGFLITSQGMDWYIAPLFSLLAFAGAIQFLAIPMLVTASSYVDIAIATLLVNFRHIFYGISLLHFLPDKEKKTKRLWFIFCISDENYSLLTSSREVDRKNAFFIVILNHSYWIFGSLLGATVATGLPPVVGLDYSLTALFAVLFVEQFLKKRDLILLGTAISATLVAWALFPSDFLIASSFIALGMLYVDFYLKTRNQEDKQ